MILINTKNYVAGPSTLKLAKKIQKYLPHAVVAIPAVNIQEIHDKTKLVVFAQHIDSQKGRATGFLLPETARKAGAQGTILNHSEHPLPFKILKETVHQAKKAKLRVVLCASSIAEAKKLLPLHPEAIAFEDKKLIGTGKSITQYRSEEVKKFADLLRSSHSVPLCGAGINSIEDVRAAHALGCHGVLIASAIAKEPNSKKTENFLKELSKLHPHFL